MSALGTRAEMSGDNMGCMSHKTKIFTLFPFNIKFSQSSNTYNNM